MPQINELTTRTFDGDSLIGFDVENTDPQTQAQYPYVTGKADGNAVANFIANGQEYVTDLNTVDKHINGAINELHAINGYSYDAYDDTSTYAAGDLCIYNNALYKCTTAITTAEAWNSDHWTATSIAGAINELKTDKQDEIIPVVLNNNLTYHSNCSIQNGFIIRYGRIIEVGMILKATGNINNNDIIVSGLPRALQNRRCPRGLGTDQWYANTDYTSGGLAVDIDENDQTKAIIRNFSNITASSNSPKYIYMSFSYVTMN